MIDHKPSGRRPTISFWYHTPTRIRPAASSDPDGRILDHYHDSEPRPQTFLDWLVWLSLLPIVMAVWFVTVQFVLVYVVVGFSMEELLEIGLRRNSDSDRSARRDEVLTKHRRTTSEVSVLQPTLRP